MLAPMWLHQGFDTALRSLATKTKCGAQIQRLLAPVATFDGARPTEKARIGGVSSAGK
jgi:hypothetical protein